MKKDFFLSIKPYEWADIMADFSFFVANKAFKKTPYDIWRTMNTINSSNCDQVRIYWEHKKDKIWIDIIFDRVKESEMFVFETGDGSFGDFIYEYYLYGPEIDQMGDKKEYWYGPDGTLHVSYDGLRIDSASDWGHDCYIDTLDTKADVTVVNNIEDKVNTLVEKAALAEPMTNSTTINTENKKEKNIMKFNFDFGPVNPATVRMSLYGLAVKNKAGTWVSYDAKTGDIMDVDILNFDGAKFLYKMPVATKDIAIGDIVIHNGIPMFVITIATNGAYITAVDPINGERKDIMLPKSPFGFNFATKVVNFLGNTFNTSATAENPFGNMWMLMAMSGENKNMDDILPFLMLNNATPGIDNNVLMFMALSNSKDGSKDMLPWLLMMNTQNSTVAAQAHTCTCGGHCGEGQVQG